MSQVKSLTLNEILVTTKDGDWGKGSPTASHAPFHVIRGTDFSDVKLGNIQKVPLRYLPERTVDRRTLQPNDILIETAGGSRGRPTGRTLLITEESLKLFPGGVTCASFARFLRVDPKKADPRYVYWYLQNLHRSGAMWQHQVQHTGVARFQYTKFAQTEKIPLPPPEEQKAIDAVLVALDGKIAANERIATKALELADTSFSFEAASITFGSESFGSVARVAGGGTPKTKEEDYWEGDISWATPTDVTALGSPYLFRTSRSITPLGLENCASQLYPAQSIFMTSRATIGAFALPQIPAAVNQGFIVVLPPTEELRWWLFHEMRSRVDEMRSLANGSTFLELSRKNFKAMPVRIPEHEVLQRFSAMAGPLHRSACNAADESRTLAELRDTLLPQLMSGKLRVKDAEKLVEDAT